MRFLSGLIFLHVLHGSSPLLPRPSAHHRHHHHHRHRVVLVIVLSAVGENARLTASRFSAVAPFIVIFSDGVLLVVQGMKSAGDGMGVLLALRSCAASAVLQRRTAVVSEARTLVDFSCEGGASRYRDARIKRS